MPEENENISLKPSQIEGWASYVIRQENIAFQSSINFSDDVPGWYRRTYLFGIALGPFVAAVAGLFDYDAKVWIWRMNDRKFRPVILTKRAFR